jgi:hypothetical protein
MAMGRRAHNARSAINFMYQNPIFSTKDLATAIAVAQPTADTLIQAFVNSGLLTEATGLMRNRVFVFDLYLKLFTK